MKIQEFIEKAIDGGWEKDDDLEIDFIFNDGEDKFYFMGDNTVHSVASILLDPKAWQAVGKVEGWNCESWKYKENGDEIPDGYRRTIWQNEMKGMIDHLIEGGTIESYLETL